ncbi:MAG: hypothetical protein JWM58_3968 [Rhizobium sp.]|nr:hypothetical protein [Rhizobium sp.]
MDIAADEMITPAEFPELRMLVWNRDPARPISADEVFQIYERNWRFVDASNLSEREAALIERLKQRFGRGVLLAP